MLIIDIFHDRIKQELIPYGYNGKNICDARLFVEYAIGDYWVDTPPKYRDEVAKEYAKKCSALKKIKKHINEFARSVGVRIVYKDSGYFIKTI